MPATTRRLIGATTGLLGLLLAAAVPAGAATTTSAGAGAAPAAAGTARTEAPSSPSAGPSAYPSRPVSRLVVRMKDRLPVDRRVAAAVAEAAGVEGAVALRRTAGGAAVVALSEAVPEGRAEEAARAVAARGDVLWAQPDRWVYPTSDPVPAYDQKRQWNLWDTRSATGGYGVKPASAWLASRGSRSVVVAVVDTGITAHPDLAGHVVPGYDFVSADDLPPGAGLNVRPLTANDGDGRDADPSDPGDWITASESSSYNFFKGCPVKRSSWHGTHVTGIVVAQPNGSGVVGVAPDVVVQPVRAIGKCAGSESDIADAIIWASGGTVPGVPANATPASVVNLSLGGPGRCSPLIQGAVTSARSRGAVVVSATGNGGGSVYYRSASNPGSFPANCTGVVAVAATSRSGGPGLDGGGAVYANTGSKVGQVTLSAPGGTQDTDPDDGIWSTVNAGATRPTGPAYASYVGTSMAAPHVSAAAALLQSMRLGSAPLTPSQMTAALRSLTRPFSPTSRCAKLASQPCGAGILDLSRLAPQQVVAEPRDGAVRVSWLAPADVGAVTASGYLVDRYEEAATSPVSIPVGAGQTSLVDTGLGNGTPYSYVVRAQLGASSTASDRTDPASPSSSPEPTMPAAVAVTPLIAGLAVTWSPPDEGAAEVTGYVVQYRSSAAAAWTCALPFGGQCLPAPGGASATSYTIDLSSVPSPGGDYDVRVTAGTSSGLSAPSRPVRVSIDGLRRSASLSGTTLRPFVDGYQDTVTIAASTDLESTAEVRIAPEGGGAPVRTFVLPPASTFNQVWDGTDDASNPVPLGRYVVEVVTDDLAGESAIPTAAPLVVTVAGSDVSAPRVTSSSPAVFWRKDGFRDSVAFVATTDVPARAVFSVTNATGTRTFWQRTVSSASLRSTAVWTGRRSSTGAVLPSGTYRLRVTVVGVNGSRAKLNSGKGIPVSVSARTLKAVAFRTTLTPDQVSISALRGGVVRTKHSYDGTSSPELRVRGGLAGTGSVYDVLALSTTLPATVAAKGYSGVKVSTCLRRSPVGTNILGTGSMASPTTFAGWFAALVDESAGDVTVKAGTIDCRTPKLTTPGAAAAGGRLRWTLFNWGASRTSYVPVYRFTITGTRYVLS